MSDLPAPSYAVDVAALDARLAELAVLVERAVELAAQRHQHDPRQAVPHLPADHAQRTRSGLAASEPLDPVVDLRPAIENSNLDARLVDFLGTFAPVVSLQLLAAHGLLGRPVRATWMDGPAHRVTAVLDAAHARGAGPSLLEAEALLAGLDVDGLDAPAALAHGCTHRQWDGSILAVDWPAEKLSPWVARNVDLLLARHESDAKDYGYVRERVFVLLGLLDPLPPHVSQWLFERALGARVTDREAAQSLLGDHPDRADRCLAALKHRTAGVRSSTAGWLAGRPLPDDERVVAALEVAVRAERDDAVLGALLDALAAHGLRAIDYLDRASLDEIAERAASKPLPASLAWLAPESLPRLTWAGGGDPVPVATVRSWVQQAVKAKSPEPNALIRTMLGAVEPEGRAELSDALLHLWLSAGAPTASRGILAVVAPGAGERTAAVAATFVRTRAKQQGTPAQALVALLARIDSPLAVQALVEAADSSGHAGVRKAAVAEVEALAGRRGLTVEQVGDRGAPTAGFDASGQMALSFGGRSFTAVLQPDLKVAVVAEGLATRPSLPAARASDDADLVAAARARLAAAKKTVVATGKTQTARLRQAMSVQRAWTVEDWYADIAGHPVLGRIATGLIWMCDGVAFRPLDDGTLTDADDAPVELLDPSASITLAHDVLLDADQIEAWRTHLADYEVAVPFAQLGDPLPPFDPEATGLTDVVGSRTSASALHRLAERAGFTRLVDGGVVAAYSKGLVGDVGATLEVRGGAWVGDWSAEVELGVLLVTGPAGPVRLDTLPPVQLAELRRDLAGLAG